jgi:hypothetical protein
VSAAAAARPGADALERIAAIQAEGDTLPLDNVQDINAATVLTAAADHMAGSMPGEVIAGNFRQALRQPPVGPSSTEAAMWCIAAQRWRARRDSNPRPAD